jgi:hypothetical protein
MSTVELHVSADELSNLMDKMRIWLDDNSISAQSFKYDREADGTVVVALTFADEAHANAFANAFSGTVR